MADEDRNELDKKFQRLHERTTTTPPQEKKGVLPDPFTPGGLSKWNGAALGASIVLAVTYVVGLVGSWVIRGPWDKRYMFSKPEAAVTTEEGKPPVDERGPYTMKEIFEKLSWHLPGIIWQEKAPHLANDYDRFTLYNDNAKQIVNAINNLFGTNVAVYREANSYNRKPEVNIGCSSFATSRAEQEKLLMVIEMVAPLSKQRMDLPTSGPKKGDAGSLFNSLELLRTLEGMESPSSAIKGPPDSATPQSTNELDKGNKR